MCLTIYSSIIPWSYDLQTRFPRDTPYILFYKLRHADATMNSMVPSRQLLEAVRMDNAQLPPPSQAQTRGDNGRGNNRRYGGGGMGGGFSGFQGRIIS